MSSWKEWEDGIPTHAAESKKVSRRQSSLPSAVDSKI